MGTVTDRRLLHIVGAAAILLASGCSPPSVSQQRWVVIHNRTTEPVVYGFADPVPPCSTVRLSLEQLNSIRPDWPPLGVWSSSLGISPPRGYQGEITVVVSADDEAVVFGPVSEDLLPACGGSPPER